MCMSFVSTVSTYIVLNALEILMPSVNSVNIYSTWWYGSKALSLSFPKLFRIENQLNIKKVMGRNVWMCFDSSIDSLDKHSIQCIACFDFHIDKIPYSTHNSIALIFCINCLDMTFNVHSNYNVDSNTKTSNYMKI